MPAPSVVQVREQVAILHQKAKGARVIGIRASEWAGPDTLEIDGTTFRVALCRSPLHVREELVDAHEGTGGLVILTPVSEHQLGDDVLARLAKRQLFEIDTWRIALDLFQARSVDPRVQRARWLADALVENAPPGGYEPVASGVLDVDTVWDALLRRRLGFADGRPDAASFVRWAETPGAVETFLGLSQDFREGVRQRLRETAGAVALAMLDALEVPGGVGLVTLGLACRVLFDPAAPGELRDAAIRFERFHRQHPFPPELGLHWAEAAERVFVERESELGWAAVRPYADRADRLLTDLGAQSFLYLGRWSPAGLEQRLGRFADRLQSALVDPAALSVMEQAATYALEHRTMRVQEARGRRVEMARLLARWLHRSSGPEPATLLDAVQAYCRDGAFVDLARLALLGGDHPPELGRVYSELLDRARRRREAGNERFGRLLAEAGAEPPRNQLALVPVERVLEEVLAPVAGAHPVLLLVIDGLSRPVYQELLDAVRDGGWESWKPDRGELEGASWAALAAIPSITEVSRTSLFCGALRRGNASDEKRGFSSHPALLHVSRPRRPPVVFHKGELLESSGRGLASEVRSAIAEDDQRILAVVLNVVDDLLFKGDQIQPRWTLETAPLLRELFEAARVAGRALIVTSDHGHLLDDDTAFQGREAGDRWRADDGRAQEGEVRVEGPRVLAHEGRSAVVPWSERLRYGLRKNGYHGGVSPQEVVLPLSLLTWGDVELPGFVKAPVAHPDWWFESVVAPVPVAAAARAVAAPARTARPLLDAIETPVPADVPAAAAPSLSWVHMLLASGLFAEQKKMSAGRGIPPDEDVRRLLVALSERGGRMTRAALARRLGVPPFRLSGLIVATRRLLNVDGLQVLDIDEPSDTVLLNRGLLDQQFELREP